MIKRMAIFGGTHGNEWTGVYAVKNLEKEYKNKGLPFELEFQISNPEAIKQVRRYVERDLNRCFADSTLNKPESECLYEELLAKKYSLIYGPRSNRPVDFIIDLHTTTSSMGPTIIISLDDDLSFNVAKYLASKNPEIKIIKEHVPVGENPFLNSLSPHSLTFEVGPIPQGVLNAEVYFTTIKMIDDCLEFLSLKEDQRPKLDHPGVFYQVIGPIDYPRDENGEIKAMVHPDCQDKSFQLLKNGDPIFLLFDGETIHYSGEDAYPIFINEAAYYEKGVAMVLNKKIEY